MTPLMTPPEGPGLLDLSRPVHDAMMVYPGDPAVALGPGLTLADDGVAVARLSCGTHTGTHLDAPSHTVPGGRTTSEISLEELVGPTLVVHVDADAGRLVALQQLEPLLPPHVPPRVFLSFGWDTFFGTDRAREHPGLSAEAAALLWTRGMRVLGTDALSPDLTHGPEGEGDGDTSDGDTCSAAPADGPGFPVHEVVLGQDGLIVENLTGLRGLPTGEHTIGIFPLPLEECDGAPARVVAWER
ncbi:cyclase family protein [Nesterenkonia suensis]